MRVWADLYTQESSPLEEKSDEFFAEIAEFRKVNRDLCEANLPITADGDVKAALRSREPAKPPPPAQPRYRLNERLFPEKVFDPAKMSQVPRQEHDA